MIRPPACLTPALLIVLAHAPPALARETGAHVHGRVEMAVVREGALVTVELRSPLHNLVGFERAPASEAEREIWKAANATVASPDRLFTLDRSARCTLRSSRTGVLGGPPPAGTGPSDHEHAGDHDHDHGEDDHDSLSDAVLTYVFDCPGAAKLSRISVQAFGAFRRIEAVDLVYLDGSRQMAKKLTPGDAEFRTR